MEAKKNSDAGDSNVKLFVLVVVSISARELQCLSYLGVTCCSARRLNLVFLHGKKMSFFCVAYTSFLQGLCVFPDLALISNSCDTNLPILLAEGSSCQLVPIAGYKW